MGRHDELRKTWQPGQCWETCNLNKDGTLMNGWCPVGNGGYAEPMWDEHQEYRQCQPRENTPPAEDRVMVQVDALALRQVLVALTGQPHEIRELQMTRNVGPDPIGVLLQDFNRAASIIAGNGHAQSS